MDDTPQKSAPARRTIIGGLTLAAVAGVVLTPSLAQTLPDGQSESQPIGGGRPASVKREKHRRPYVLVPGAWHGGWCWHQVAKRLSAAGHRVYAPTLTGLGERAHLLTPQTDLETHIIDIVSVIAAEELEDVVLVGHSYAGLVITGVADRIPESLAHVVYLDAILVKPGESSLSVQSGEFADRIKKLQAAGSLVLPPPRAAALGIPESDPQSAWVERRMTPHPLATLTQPLILNRGGADSLPRVYIDCVKPSIFGPVNPFAQKARAQTGWTVATMETGHDAMITAPDALTRLLLQVG